MQTEELEGDQVPASQVVQAVEAEDENVPAKQALQASEAPVAAL